jgi:glycosyltransferase involved in cell wall biosynthesis
MDDASTDGTPQLATEFQDEPRVAWMRNAENLGMAANWRAGIERVESGFFCLLNDDDTIEPDFIERLIVPMLADDDLILTFCDHWIIDPDGKRLDKLTNESSATYHRSQLEAGTLENFAEAAVLHRSLHISCSLLRTAMVPASFIDEQAGGFACGWLFYQCFRTGYNAYYIAERLASYRLHDGNMSNDEKWHSYINEGQIYWCHCMLRDSLLAPLRPRLRVQISAILSSYGWWLLACGLNERARTLFSESWSLRTNSKALIGYYLAKLGPRGIRTASALRRRLPRVRVRSFSQWWLAGLSFCEAQAWCW